MVSKNNVQLKDRYATKQVPHYGIRKLSVGVASVLLSTTLYMGVTAHADTLAETNPQPTIDQPTDMKSGTSTSSVTADVQSAAGQLASNGVNTSTGNATTDVQSKPTADQSASMATNSATPKNEASAKAVPTVLPKQPSNATDAQSTAVTSGSQLATNFNVESDNNGSAAKPAEQSTDPATLMTNFAVTEQPVDDTHNPVTTTLPSKFTWAIHYTDETGKKLLPDSVITHDYTRTDTGDQMGNWSYVPDSLKVTGTPNNGWNIDKPAFKFDQAAGGTTFDFATWYAVAASIDGYTPNYGSVVLTDQLPKNPESLHATSTVDSGTHEFTFVYTKQPTKVTINYVDDEQGEKVVGTGTVSGKTGSEVTITPQLPKDYMLTPNKDVPSMYTVTDADNQVVTIHVQKQFVDTSATDPQAKQTRTVTLHYVYGAGDKQGQKAFDDAVLDVYYHRTATLDRATNETTYGDWLWDQSQGDSSTPGYHVVSGKWTSLPQTWANVAADVPSIKGYYADLGQNDPTNTNHIPSNTWVFPTYNNSLGGGISEDGKGATAYLDGYGYEVNPTHTIKYMPNQTTVTVNYVDDDNNKAVVGSQHWDGTTGQHIDLTLTPPDNYVLTPGWVNPTSYDFDGVNSSWYTVHVKHKTQDVTDQQPKDQVNKTVTRKVTIVAPDGKPTVTNQTVTFTRNAIVDEVTGNVTYGPWSENGKHEFVTVDVPNVPGYTATGDVPSLTVTPDSKDTDITINYTANEQSTQIVFVDKDGKTVDTVDVNGKTGETVETNAKVPDKWKLVDNETVPSTITFSADTPKTLTVHVEHKIETKQLKINVDLDLLRLIRFTYDINKHGDTYLQWINNDELNVLDDLLDNYYAGKPVRVGSVTGSVQYDLVSDEIVKVNDQTFKFSKTLLNYPSDNDVANGGSLTGGYDLVNHTFTDYLNEDTHNNLSYKVYASANLTKDLFTNKELFLFAGSSSDSATIPFTFENGKQYGSDYEINTSTIDNSFSINFGHLFKTAILGAVENDDGSLSATAILHMPIAYQPYISKTVTRTINITNPDGAVKTIKQTAEINQNVSSGFDWKVGDYLRKGDTYVTDNNWSTYEVPTIDGYTANQSQVNAVAVDGNTTDQTVNISYTANKQQVNINYVDISDDNKVVHTTTVNGVTDGDVTVTNELPTGYKLVDGQSVPKTVHFNANNNDDINVKVQHATITVTPDSPKTPSDKLPDNPDKSYPSGVSENDLNKTVTRTIKVTQPNGTTIKQVQTVKLTRTATVDEVTGEVTYGKWSTGQWDSYDVPSVAGYTASQPSVETTPVNENTKDQTVDVSYTPNKQSTTIKYVDDKGDVVHTTTVDGVTNQTVKVPSEIPAGWTITKGQVPNEITFGADGHEPIEVTVAHQHVTVTPDHPQNNGTKLPDNPAKTFKGVEANDLNKTITRTIKVTTPEGQTKTVAQTSKLTRTADVDEVTGEVTYGKWTTGKWSNYDVPAVPGYTASQNEVPAVEVTSDTTDQTIDISYTANSQTIHINYVDSAGKTVRTIAVTGKTGDTVNLSLAVPDKYQLADGQQLPTTYTFTAVSGDVTIHLAHKVVQREATVDVQIGLMTLVDLDDESEPGIVVTQNQWRQLDDEIKKHALVNDLEEVDPTVEVGTLTRHVNYDLVDEKVVSFADDWTTLNLGGQTYQMPDGTDVVNGIIVGTQLSWGEKLKEHALKYLDDLDYATYPWHGYLSVNKSNIDPDYAGFRLVGNEPNALAKAAGDHAATAIEMTNKPIDLSSLQDVIGGGLSDFNEQDGQLRAKAIVPVVGVYIPYVEKTATRTINVTTPDGKTTSVKQTATLVKQVTGQEDAHPAWTTGEWASYDVPTIPGYTASQSSVAKETVIGTTEDQTVNITYTANPQTTTVVYQTEDGTPVHTTTVNGHTGQTVKVPTEVPVGWRIVNGKVPSEITFEPNGTPKTVVTIAHSHVTVAPDAPKTTSDKLPDNPGKTYPAGVGETDLNKTVTRTIKVTQPNGTITTKVQTVKLTRTATVDEVTGDVSYGKWLPGEWDAYEVPIVDGYTAMQTSVAATPVDEHTADQTVEVSYVPNKQTTTIKYVDDKGEVIHTTTVDGVTNQTVKVPSEVPAGWMITKGQVPSELTFGADGHEPIEVTIAHQHVTVTPDHPQDNGTKLPDNPDKTFNGVEANDLNKTITRTIKVTTPDGQTKTVAQTAHLTRTADVDEVTGEVTYGNWTSGEWAAYDAPSVAGYTPSQTTVAKESVMAASKDTTTTITYAPTQHQISVEYVDDDDHDKVVKTDQVPGKTDQTITITPSAPTNYDLVDSNNRTYNVTSADEQTVQINVKHHQVKTTESKTVIRTINVHTPHDRVKTVKQTATLNRDVTTDQVTGEKTYGDWTIGQWKTYTPEAIPGYTPSINEVPNINVDGSSSDQTVDVTYTADAQKVEIVYVDDAKGGAVVKTDQVVGKTDETVKVTPDVPAGYKVVGKVPGSYTLTANGHQMITVHLAHQTKTIGENKTVTRTINFHTPHDGVKTIKQTAKLSREVTTDQVTGEKTYGDWSTTLWDHYAVPAVAGYVPSIKQVAQQVVNGTTTDQTINVIYTSGEHTTHINYVDGDGNTVHTTTINGQTDGTAQVPNEVPAGWTVVGEPVPTELAFGPDGHADVTVTISHKHVTVASDQPKTSSDKLPDNPAKTYPNGVGYDDLNKTITRTIKITTPDGQTKTVEQTAHLTRTADVDEVTGEVTYGGWTTGEWSNYDVPAVPGYTPSQSEVSATKVTDTTKNQTVTIGYTANNQTTHVNYVDGNGKTVHTTTITGKTAQTVKVPNETPAGWTVTDGQVPDEITFGPNGHADVTVTVGHQHVTVTPDQPKTSADKLPDNPGKSYPVGVGHDDLSKTITRTIKITTPDGQTKTVEQTVHLTRTADVDEVTGEVTYGGWTTGEWSNYDVPVVPGYTPSQSEVPATKVTDDNKNQTVTIGYTANDQTTHVSYVDGDGKTVHTTIITGKTDQTVKVPNETPAGWIITNGQVPTEITFGPDGHADVTVTVGHQHVTVTPDQPQADGTKLPDNPSHTFHGVAETDLNKTITRTIKVTTPDGKTDTIKQTAKLTRTADVDEVTGEVTYGKWTTGVWSSYAVPTVAGYTPSQAVVAEVAVNSDMTDQMVTVTYTADSYTTHINYVDENGNVVHTTTVTGQTDQTVKVPNETPAGWTITTGQVPSEVTFGADGHTDVTVSIDHQTVTVTPDHPQADDTKLPDNPTLTFHGVDEGDLNKTVTRTIKLNVPGQAPQVITQTARLTRTATVDEVTGEVIYDDWTSGQWNAYEVPAVDGYTADQTMIPSVNVTSETTSQDIVIDYVAVPTAQTTPSNDQTDESQVTPEKVVKVTNGNVQETKQNAVENPVQSTVQGTKQLPQTGNDNRAGLLSLIGSSLMASLAVFGLGKKKKHGN